MTSKRLKNQTRCPITPQEPKLAKRGGYSDSKILLRAIFYTALFGISKEDVGSYKPT